jgi:hypothetical protein
MDSMTSGEDRHSRQEQRGGTRSVLLWGAGFAIIVLAGVIAWALVAQQAPSRGQSAATGIRSNQGAGVSMAAKDKALAPAPTTATASGGNLRDTSGAAAQIDQSSGALKLSDAQRERIHSYFAGKQPDRTDSVSFSLSIGAAVPQQVQLQSLPADISDVMQGFKDDDYLLVKNQLVIVEPQTRRIVALIPNAG